MDHLHFPPLPKETCVLPICRIYGRRPNDCVISIVNPEDIVAEVLKWIPPVPRQLSDQIRLARQLPARGIWLVIIQKPPKRVQFIPDRLLYTTAYRRRLEVRAYDPSFSRCPLRCEIKRDHAPQQQTQEPFRHRLARSSAHILSEPMTRLRRLKDRLGVCRAARAAQPARVHPPANGVT